MTPPEVSRAQVEGWLRVIVGHGRIGYKGDAARRLGMAPGALSRKLAELPPDFVGQVRALSAEAMARIPRVSLPMLMGPGAAKGLVAANVTRPGEREARSEPFPVDEVRARALHAQGLDSKAIADELGVPWVTVIEWYVRQRSLSPNPVLRQRGLHRGNRKEEACARAPRQA